MILEKTLEKKTVGILPIASCRVNLTASGATPTAPEMQETFSLLREHLTIISHEIGNLHDEAFQAKEDPTRALCFAGSANSMLPLLEVALHCMTLTARYYAGAAAD